MEVIPKKNGQFMPKALWVKPSGPPPQYPYAHMILQLIVFLRVNCF